MDSQSNDKKGYLSLVGINDSKVIDEKTMLERAFHFADENRRFVRFSFCFRLAFRHMQSLKAIRSR